MRATAVTSKGQVTIPPDVRRQLGIRQGSRVAFQVRGDHAELRIVEQPANATSEGFGLLKSRRSSVKADFDPATSLLPPRGRR